MREREGQSLRMRRMPRRQRPRDGALSRAGRQARIRLGQGAEGFQIWQALCDARAGGFARRPGYRELGGLLRVAQVTGDKGQGIAPNPALAGKPEADLVKALKDHAGRRIPRDNQTPDRRPGPAGPCGKPVQMRYPRPYPARRDACRGENGVTTRRPHACFLAAPFWRRAAALVVTFALTSGPIHAQAARRAARPSRRRSRRLHRDRRDWQGHDLFGKGRVGTGAITAIAQIAAEELCVALDRVTMIQGDTQLTPNQGPTYASLTIQDGGMQIRRAAATARKALLQRAADKLKVAIEKASTRPGPQGACAVIEVREAYWFTRALSLSMRWRSLLFASEVVAWLPRLHPPWSATLPQFLRPR